LINALERSLYRKNNLFIDIRDAQEISKVLFFFLNIHVSFFILIIVFLIIHLIIIEEDTLACYSS